MQLQLNEEDRRFQEEVRTFLSESLDPNLSQKVKLGYPISKEEQDGWTRTLNARGWAAPNWPVEVGGPGWTMLRRHLFDIEMKMHHAPELQGFGFSLVGPAIITSSADPKFGLVPQSGLITFSCWYVQITMLSRSWALPSC